MKELVGHCSICGKEVYCLEGFLNGIVTEDNELCCFECEEHRKTE